MTPLATPHTACLHVRMSAAAPLLSIATFALDDAGESICKAVYGRSHCGDHGKEATSSNSDDLLMAMQGGVNDTTVRAHSSNFGVYEE